jgi:hypothetical protein
MSDLPNTPKSAALSQTAGVPEGWKLVPVEPTAAMCDAMRISVGDGIAMKPVYRAMLAAAPSASGGESHPDALPDGTPSKSTEKRLTAASVSERARELRERAEAHGGGVFVSIGDIRALEKALTQQRGAEWSDDLRAVLDAASEASQVPLMWLANQDFSPEQTKAWLCEAVDATVEEGAFSGSLHQVAEEGTGHVVAFTGCGPKSAANAKFLIGCVHFILKHRDALATTPQPSADAVRELAAKWRKRAERKRFVGLKNEALLDEAHAHELESLLSGGSHA